MLMWGKVIIQSPHVSCHKISTGQTYLTALGSHCYQNNSLCLSTTFHKSCFRERSQITQLLIYQTDFTVLNYIYFYQASWSQAIFLFDSNLAISELELSVVQMLQKLVHLCFLPWSLFAPLLPLMQINNIALLKLRSCRIWQGEHRGNAGESGITYNFPQLLAGASHTGASSFLSRRWLSFKQGG